MKIIRTAHTAYRRCRLVMSHAASVSYNPDPLAEPPAPVVLPGDDALVDEALLRDLKKRIDRIDEFHHKYLFAIFKEDGVRFSKNMNGTFINISYIKPSTYRRVLTQVEYIETQEKMLTDVEREKAALRESMPDDTHA
jgi:hypothetical protein